MAISRARTRLFLPAHVTALALLLCACDGRGGALPAGNAEGAEYQAITVTPSVVAQLEQAERARLSPHSDGALPMPQSYAYQIGVGDILNVGLWLPSPAGMREGWRRTVPGGTEEMNYSSLPVKPDGQIAVPLVGDVPVADKTLDEAKQALMDAASQYFRQPQVSVDVKSFNARRAVITGEVMKPGEQPLTYVPLSLVQAVRAADGPTPAADLSDAVITRRDGTTENVDLFALLHAGDGARNYILQDGDRLHIPANHGNKVFVMGEVTKPALRHIHGGRMSLAEALSDAEGLQKETASYAHVYVVRGVIGKELMEAKAAPDSPTPPAPLQTKVYHVDITSGTGLAMAANFPLRPLDVVYVSPTPVSQWGKFISQLIPVNAAALVATGVYASD